jgi:hypothetical protein
MKTTPKAPRHLSSKAKILWKSINSEYELEADALETLRIGLENMDLADQARELLRNEGLVVNGKPHAAGNAVKLHDGLYLRCFRALALDVVAVGQPVGRRQ